jgi:hypothetical protein
MRMPRVRFTVRRMMIAVACVGIVVSMAEATRRIRFYRERARFWSSIRVSYEVTLVAHH